PSPTYTLSLHDALPISRWKPAPKCTRPILRILIPSGFRCYGGDGSPTPILRRASPLPFSARPWRIVTGAAAIVSDAGCGSTPIRSEEHTSELQSRFDLV